MNRASTRSAHRFSMSIAKARPCNPAKVSGNRSSSRANRRKRAIASTGSALRQAQRIALRQAKPRSTTQRRGSGAMSASKRSTKPRLASDRLTTSSRMPWAWASAAGCSPVSPWSTNATLRRFGWLSASRAFRFVGGRDDHASAGSAHRGQQLVQRINRHVDFAAPPACGGGKEGGRLCPS